MNRTTIDYGIDLGTTNSAIAVISGVDATVIKNDLAHDTTPSAVMIDHRGRLYVGQTAYDNFVYHEPDVCVEFKLRMGKAGQEKVFASSGRQMTPEELSAEVLKSLRADVLQATGEQIRAAVITVPAAFGVDECAATSRSAAAAGLEVAPLLQEPTAAAMAYGFQTTSDNVFWLAYDLGGGTFDAAVVHVRDGDFSVIQHAGDRFLGGKLIDWDIVEKLLIPAVVAQHDLPDLARGNGRWTAEVAKLKRAAEAAKIRLSRQESADVLVHPPLRDGNGREFEFEFTLHRSDVARLAEPYLARSVGLCRDALDKAGLAVGDIERVLLVGGPTLAPYVREYLADAERGLGITLDLSQDPLTVVARGAAIFGRTQRLRPAQQSQPAGQLGAELEYSPVGPDAEPLVGGRIISPDEASLNGFTVEFVSADAKPLWRSGKIALSSDGEFALTLKAEPGRMNLFTLFVYDDAGSRHDVTPDRITYTMGITPTRPTLTHAVGVGLYSNKVIWLVERGAELPARRVVLLRQAVRALKGQGLIRIPVVEGEHSRADRNRSIGTLELRIGAGQRGVPEGAEVQLTVVIDASRLVSASAYVPLLDLPVDGKFDLTEHVPEYEQLSKAVRAELDRWEAARSWLAGMDNAPTEILERNEAEGIGRELVALCEAARADPDAAIMADKRLLDLRAAIDEIEDAREWPDLVRDATGLVDAAREIIGASGDNRDAESFRSIEESLAAAVTSRDADLLRQRCDELRTFATGVLRRSGDLARLRFEQLQQQSADMSDPDRAASLISRGNYALRDGAMSALENINRQLAGLLPSPPPDPDPFSTVVDG